MSDSGSPVAETPQPNDGNIGGRAFGEADIHYVCNERVSRLRSELASRDAVIQAARACEESYECCDEVTMRGTVPNYLMGNLMSELIRLRALLVPSGDHEETT